MKIAEKQSVVGFVLCMIYVMIISAVRGQDYDLKGVELRDLNGELVSSQSVMDCKTPLLMVFWNNREKDCTKQIEALMNAKAENFTDERLTIIGIFVSSGNCASNVKASVYGSGWEGRFFIDFNGDLKRVMGIPGEPYTILFNHKKEVVCRYEGYCSGAEDILCEKVKHCLDDALREESGKK